MRYVTEPRIVSIIEIFFIYFKRGSALCYLKFDILVRSYCSQAICHTCWFTSDSLYTCKSKGTILNWFVLSITCSRDMNVNTFLICIWMVNAMCWTIFLFSGCRTYACWCSIRSKSISWHFVLNSTAIWILEGLAW